MSIILFKEESDFSRKGVAPFEPKHSISMVKDNIDAVYYPYIIGEAYMSYRMEQKLKKLVPQKYQKSDIEFEYVLRKIPRYVCSFYRNKNLKENFPTLHKKPLVLFFFSDCSLSFGMNSSVLIARTSVNRSTITQNDILVPPRILYTDWEGPLQKIKPSIGFCGCPNTHSTREQQLKELGDADTIEFDATLTRGFYNHVREKIKGKFSHLSEERQEILVENARAKMKKNFHEILQRNIFSFCPRGRGNYSIRFYETLREGRIPVMVDTDQVLPCEDIIDWDDTIIFAKTTDEAIEKMHDWVENRDLIEVQKRCREVWETYLHFPTYLELFPRYVEQYINR